MNETTPFVLSPAIGLAGIALAWYVLMMAVFMSSNLQLSTELMFSGKAMKKAGAMSLITMLITSVVAMIQPTSLGSLGALLCGLLATAVACGLGLCIGLIMHAFSMFAYRRIHHS